MRYFVILCMLILQGCSTVNQVDLFDLAYTKYENNLSNKCGDISDYKEKGAVNINRCDFDYLIQLMSDINYPYIHYLELTKTRVLAKSLQLDRGTIDLEEHEIIVENINAEMNVTIIEEMNKATNEANKQRSESIRAFSNSLNTINHSNNTTTTNCIKTGSMMNCNSY